MLETETAARRSLMKGAGAEVLLCIVAAAVVAATGGAASPLLPLLALPVVAAAGRGARRSVLLCGLAMAALYVAFHGRSVPAILSFLLLPVTGVLAVRGRRSSPASQPIAASERAGLLDMAYTDPMTGLYNFRKFRAHLDEELRRASRYGHSVSLILIDLDAFKQINDRFGHPAGDRVLTSAASTIRASVRQTDLPARYGGEEFVVVCPETGTEEAYLVAERIRSSIEAAQHEVGPGKFCAITCSLGIASFPEHARDEVGLIEAADAALYHAKRHGKNRADAPQPSRATT